MSRIFALWRKNSTVFLNFWEDFEKYITKLAENALFLSLFKIISKPCVIFLCVLTKTQLFVLKLWENLQNFLLKIAKLHYSGLFSKQFQKPALNFRTFWRITQVFGKILRKLSKISWENSKKSIILACC